MLRNYLTIAVRNIWRNKFFSLIHILGLSIGISASLVIFLIVNYELSFDKFEPDSERIYRVVMNFKMGDMSGTNAAVPAPLSNAIQNEVSGVDATIPVMQFQGDASVNVIAVRDNRSEVFKKQPDVVFTNNGYFQLMPFEWIAGSPSISLAKPFSVVITESRAKQYFPGVDAGDLIGRRLTYNDNIETQITGVVKDFEETTDFTAKEFISYATIFETALYNNFMMDVWDEWMAYSKVWVKLSDKNDKAGVEKQLGGLLEKYKPAKTKDSNNTQSFLLQPLDDVHFNTAYASFGQRTADLQTLYGLLAISAFLLLLGCINFVNLSTAQSSQRAKEIGIRKTIGSTKKQLILQFMAEALLVTFLATIFSISITPMLLQLFADFIPAGVNFDFIKDPSLLAIPIVLLFVVGLIAGFYPAIVLSKFRPAVVLKSQSFVGSPTRNAGLRKVLTVSQFAIAQFFIIAAVMIGKQIHFALNQDLGYRKDAIINFEIPRDTVSSHIDRLRNSINEIPGIQMVSVGFFPPATAGGAFGNIKYNNGKEEINPMVQLRWGDTKYIEVYDIKLAAGRNIREGKHINEVLINQSYAKALGFEDPTDALQKELINGDGSRFVIVGVMHDFHEGSLHQPIGNIIFRTHTFNFFFHVALEPGQGEQWQEPIAGIEKSFHEIYPASEFHYKFFDDSIAAFYTRERQTSQLINWAMALSILISVLGLLGLVIYISEARTKEIGIRKVLGASVSNLVMILSREFVLLIFVAFAIAVPFAWYAVDQWLQSFEYKTEISTWVFLVSGFALLAIAVITLGAQTIRTATSNPVKSLRNE
jgi:ABC-type antimicrobial peptide transport system permease subunit